MKAIAGEYSRTVIQKQISEADFTHGYHQIAAQKYYPNPGTFAALCQAAATQQRGLPTVENAFREACDKSAEPTPNRFTHLAVYLAGRATGWYELRHCSTQQQLQNLKKNFREHYQQFSRQSEPDLRKQLPKPKAFRPLPPPPDYDKKQSATDARQKLKGLFSKPEPPEQP